MFNNLSPTSEISFPINFAADWWSILFSNPKKRKKGIKTTEEKKVKRINTKPMKSTCLTVDEKFRTNSNKPTKTNKTIE